MTHERSRAARVLGRGADAVPVPDTRRRRWLEQNIDASAMVLDDDDEGVRAFLDATFPPGIAAGDRSLDMSVVEP